MPITPEILKAANTAMKGNTSRAILFTTVNLSSDPSQSDPPKLSKFLIDLQAGLQTPAKFSELIQTHLTVKSFQQFLDKFKPCFYYRLVPPRKSEIVPEVNTTQTGSAENSSGDASTDASAAETLPQPETATASAAEQQSDDLRVPDALPEFEFSLEGGPVELGWKRVNITMDHPLFKNLSTHLRDRALTNRTTVSVNVDDALWGFKPDAQATMLKKSAQEFHAIGKKLIQEMRRNPESPETRQALAEYDRKLFELENVIGDDLRVLPTISYGLAQARKALGGAESGAVGPAMGRFVLELGENAKVLVRPELPEETLKRLPEPLLKQLEAGKADYEDVRRALEADSGGEQTDEKELVLLRDALGNADLALRDVKEIVKMPDDKQYPALIGSLMNDLVARHKIEPAMGNMLAVILQDPKQLAKWNVNPKEVEVFHDTFLGIYSMAVDRFIRIIVPMFETLMGIYAFFNEFPANLNSGQPELIVTNEELIDLWRYYGEELANFLRMSCHQATNQYKDAIAIAIVPAVMPLKDQSPAPPPRGYIHAGNFAPEFREPLPSEEREAKGKLYEQFADIRSKVPAKAEGFGRIAGAAEVMGLMQLGRECGFGVFFSPANPFTADRLGTAEVTVLQESYCPSSVADRDWAVSGVLCVPDFIILPPDGVLFTGTVMDGRSVGVDVPRMVVRSCYVAAGRFLANDDPDALNSVLQSLPESLRGNLKVRRLLPGVGVDLVKYPYLGRTHLAPDHYLSDPVIRTLLGREKPFLVFSHTAGQPPSIAAARTLRRIRTNEGERYVQFPHWRQQIYLSRLFYAAYHMGYGGAWPTLEEMENLMTSIVSHMSWYDESREGYVNAFPSELEGDVINVQPVMEGSQIVSFILNLPLKSAVLGPLELSTDS